LSIIDQVESASREVRNATLTGLSTEEIASATKVLDHVRRNLARAQETDP
jgi:hypothetical protein